MDALNVAALVFFVALIGGLLPLITTWSDRVLHLFITLSCGVFLGAVFLHLLPEIGEQAAHGQQYLWVVVLAGLLGVYIIEAIFVRKPHEDDAHQHAMISYAALVGLGVHSLAEGVGLAATLEDQRLAWPLVISIVSHKGAAAFSLATIFLLAAFPRRKVVLLVTAFAAVTPAGMLVGGLAIRDLTEQGSPVFTALAAGTFLFVVLCELLPEVFHRYVDIGRKLIVLLLGVAMMLLLHLLLPAAEHGGH